MNEIEQFLKWAEETFNIQLCTTQDLDNAYSPCLTQEEVKALLQRWEEYKKETHNG